MSLQNYYSPWLAQVCLDSLCHASFHSSFDCQLSTTLSWGPWIINLFPNGIFYSVWIVNSLFLNFTFYCRFKFLLLQKKFFFADKCEILAFIALFFIDFFQRCIIPIHFGLRWLIRWIKWCSEKLSVDNLIINARLCSLKQD